MQGLDVLTRTVTPLVARRTESSKKLYAACPMSASFHHRRAEGTSMRCQLAID
jgi:hypothetical protein